MTMTLINNVHRRIAPHLRGHKRLTANNKRHNVPLPLQKTTVEFERFKAKRADLIICSGFFMPTFYGGGEMGGIMPAVCLFARSFNPFHPCHLYYSLNAVTGGLLTQRGFTQ